MATHHTNFTNLGYTDLSNGEYQIDFSWTLPDSSMFGEPFYAQSIEISLDNFATVYGTINLGSIYETNTNTPTAHYNAARCLEPVPPPEGPGGPPDGLTVTYYFRMAAYYYFYSAQYSSVLTQGVTSTVSGGHTPASNLRAACT
ncbi:MAG TPA: hypothetical protein VIP09_02135 [Dehalococcoidia bacterium]